ncbi:MAG: hypothetical protein ABJQ14_09665, partial [Hyphomicrobiales bacterium]
VRISLPAPRGDLARMKETRVSSSGNLRGHPVRSATEALEGSSVYVLGGETRNYLNLRKENRCCWTEHAWRPIPTRYYLHIRPHTHAAYSLHYRDTKHRLDE